MFNDLNGQAVLLWQLEYLYGNNHHTAATGTVVTMETASMEASFGMHGVKSSPLYLNSFRKWVCRCAAVLHIRKPQLSIFTWASRSCLILFPSGFFCGMKTFFLFLSSHRLFRYLNSCLDRIWYLLVVFMLQTVLCLFFVNKYSLHTESAVILTTTFN